MNSLIFVWLGQKLKVMRPVELPSNMAMSRMAPGVRSGAKLLCITMIDFVVSSIPATMATAKS